MSFLQHITCATQRGLLILLPRQCWILIGCWLSLYNSSTDSCAAAYCTTALVKIIRFRFYTNGSFTRTVTGTPLHHNRHVADYFTITAPHAVGLFLTYYTVIQMYPKQGAFHFLCSFPLVSSLPYKVGWENSRFSSYSCCATRTARRDLLQFGMTGKDYIFTLVEFLFQCLSEVCPVSCSRYSRKHNKSSM